ncbi:MAG: hypothetical protein A3D95_01460 [Betaproteobacteria bacterium RIFCSPHIGHO2_12_FULL_69_13]|nr:MAG: hypothetical protein A3D95_01460 [Betaproteobacteria bacterium RIFCSPHIGHO2_12_FULL_69_13]OGA64394.1 MAG: hypothetical protein A3G83_17025 [Betaproteobacteria bacterium RIFCSPLOWO2_12_FULL_68_20]
MRNSPPRGEISVPGAAFTHVLFARLESIAQDESEHGLRRAPSLGGQALQSALLCGIKCEWSHT